MNVLIYLVPMALGLGLAGLFAFLWALKSGQYNDVDGAAMRVLSDDDLEKLNDAVVPAKAGTHTRASRSGCGVWVPAPRSARPG